MTEHRVPQFRSRRVVTLIGVCFGLTLVAAGHQPYARSLLKHPHKFGRTLSCMHEADRGNTGYDRIRVCVEHLAILERTH